MRSIASTAVAILLLAAALPARAGSSMAKLSSVIDGNTLQVTLRGAEVKIRMHGIVVPPADEKRPILQRLNTESVAFLKKYLADGWVYLEFPEGDAKPDAEGYVRAFVYRGSDATFLNEKLVSAGLAIVNQKEKNGFTEKWAKLQAGAQGAQLGIWGSFATGGGEKIAAGAAQGTYVGVPGTNERRTQPSYVTRWIVLYY
jgi:endonuclease YncB( thermonuclease family)